jgi:hypothetical protein
MRNSNPKINDYSSPSEYRKAIGNKASTCFCLASSKIMEKYHVTFPQTCRLLEESGYLIWDGDIPIYSLLGDKLWNGRE